MIVRMVVLASLVGSLISTVLPAQAGQSHGRACQHLIVGSASGAEHVGYTAPYPTQVDDPDQASLRWAELRTTRTQLIATIAVKELSENGGTLDHGYSMTFRTRGQSIQLMSMFGRVSSWAYAAVSKTGNQPSDDGVYAGAPIGPITAVRDLHHNWVTLTADRSLLGVTNEPLTNLGAQTWVGLAYGRGGTYGVADHASTTKSYRPGTVDCLT